ncbi:MAG: hypothetical protein CM15mP119_0020 [Alphaproteobacteria bacterium]|nr:MAG: hypothetical protein CM15mP119_0020 [Alphaproteobacteria bacterium]
MKKDSPRRLQVPQFRGERGFYEEFLGPDLAGHWKSKETKQARYLSCKFLH